MTWTDHLQADPLPWLLEESGPAVRAAALQGLLDRPADDPQVRAARRAAMAADPIRAILAAQDPAGWWVKPGPGYGPKYTGTVWQLISLDQLGADPAHPQVARACDYVLSWGPTSSGGFGCSSAAREAAPAPSSVLHCLNGNLLRAVIGFGRLDDERVQAAVEWAARAITGHGVERWYASGTSGPAFACAANEGLPCAWGALKELNALARVPAGRRSPLVQRAIDAGVDFLFSRDPLVADYPMGYGNTKPNGSWFKPGFPLGYVSDVLQTLEVLAQLGHVRDERLVGALRWLESLQDADGRWRNRHAYNGKTWVNFETQGAPSKWVTLRACTVLRAAYS
ncbi:MAG TPA: nitrogen fixation protein NifH [Actinomycetes bacterium]